jgi:NAD(P)-dependent dehydrogenase (short-subunit alcohol dehydrogenase family)
MFSPTLLNGKTALITASTSGIGLKTAEIMARSGAKAVLINGRTEAAGLKAAAELKSIAPDTDVHFVAADMTIPAEVAGLFRIAREKMGRLDIFVHANPGIGAFGPFAAQEEEAIHNAASSLFGGFPTACHHALPLMKASGGGAIVAITSDAAKLATPGETLIGGAYAGIVMFAKTLGLEEAKNNIRVNVVTPSLVQGTLTYARIQANPVARKVFAKAEQRARLGIPSPENVAPVIVFLASPLASHISGQVVSVNGGISFA